MKIAHIVAHPPFREGTGTVAYHNARQLKNLGCNVTVFAADIKVNDKIRGIHFYQFMPCYLQVGNAYLTPHILTIRNFDILHLHHPFFFGTEFTLVNKMKNNSRLVLTYHNDLIAPGIRRVIFFLYNKFMVPILLKLSNALIVTSLDYASSSVFGKMFLKKCRNKTYEIPNGVDINRFSPKVDGSKVRGKIAASSADTVLLFVSSLDRSHIRKGLFTLFDALKELDDKSIKLVIVGDGEMQEVYKNYSSHPSLSNRVFFAGRVSEEAIPQYYAASDIVTIPSSPPEAFGLALAQGMASERAVIGSSIPGVRYLIDNQVCGYLVKPGDHYDLAEKIQLMSRDPNLRREFGIRGRQRITENFTWEIVGYKLKQLYQELIA